MTLFRAKIGRASIHRDFRSCAHRSETAVDLKNQRRGYSSEPKFQSQAVANPKFGLVLFSELTSCLSFDRIELFHPLAVC